MRSLLKRAYRWRVGRLRSRLRRTAVLKTVAAEWYAILRKYPVYRHVEWTKEQKREFDDFWRGTHGRRISSRWHRLYEATNGVFRVDYIPEVIFTSKLEPLLNDDCYARVIGDKSLVELVVSASGGTVVTPATIVLNVDGRFFDSARETIGLERAVELVKLSGGAVAKPIRGSSSGRDVTILPDRSDASADTRTALDLVRTLGRNFVVQEAIRPHPGYSVYHPQSINTLRITTYLTSNGVRHGPLALRMGTGDTSVDNIHAGGLGIYVRDDGRLADRAYRLGYGDRADPLRRHPDTHVEFDGRILPKVKELVSAAHRLHGELPQLGIISWDFTLDADSRLVLIELNTVGQGIWFPQMVSGEPFFGSDLTEMLALLPQ